MFKFLMEDERNVSSETGEPLPIISIYLLGHKVDNLKESVVYVRRRYLDYDSNEIKEGVPSPFVEQLTHDSIIVQIPYLTGNVSTIILTLRFCRKIPRN